MARESAMRRAVKQRIAEAQKKLEPIMECIIDYEGKADHFRAEARVLQAQIDSATDLLSLEEQIRKGDVLDGADAGTETSKSGE